jgi:hypothetical protein
MIYKFEYFLLESSKRKTYLQQVVEVLENSKNALTIEEICDEINSVSEYKIPKSSYRSVYTIVLSFTKGKENTSSAMTRNKSGKFLFEVISDKPQRFKLVEGYDKFDTNEEDFELEDDITLFNEPVAKIKVYKPNPFKQSICVLGESGAGKSVTIETILENEGHNFEFIIPTAATTGLLAQFSPSKSGYIASRLGRMFIEASKNSDTLYTAVFDEMHKSNVIEMINDELLQAISTKRNRGRRFISLDDDTAEIYQGSELETERGNLLIPDNFGFIFISSKPRVIANNADFFNRVDIVILKSYEEETIETSEQLLSNKLSDEDKMKLASTRND